MKDKQQKIRTSLGAAVRIPSRALMTMTGDVCEVLLECGGVRERLVVSKKWVENLRGGDKVVCETLREWREKEGGV